MKEWPGAAVAATLVRTALAALALTASLHAQTPERFVVVGTVLDARTDRPLPGVRVAMPRLGLELFTDAEGSFTLPPLEDGRYAMRLERIGYQRVDGDLDVFENGDFTVTMDPDRDYERGGRVQGVVLDARSGQPVPSVLVRLGDRGPGAETDADGRFAFPGLDPGRYVVHVQALGYAERADELEVRAGRIAHAEVRLTPDPLEVESLEVSVEERWLALDVSGYYERRDAGLGLFVDRAEIQRRASREITDALLGMQGVYLVDIGDVVRGVVFRDGRRVGEPVRDWCGPDLWVDGIRVLRPEGGPTRLNRFVHPEEVVGIELYRRPAEIPLQYGGIRAGCGVIVVWTR